ncbi:MAG: cell division ATP-binding protein FtsE [Actinomycetales bacterium]|nr:cell division ATP-binding protein FtsE [Actinomycetales bacterium]
MIRFTNVTKKYAGTSRPALNGVDFEILRGEFVFLVGASGSGKSSCLRLMIKEDRPNIGSIHVLGQDLGTISSRKVPFFRRNLGVVFQDFRLLPNKTVFDNVAFTLQVIGKSRGFIQEAVPDVLKMVGLAGKAGRYPHELSGGEQQRVAIARAIVNKPALLLADEPTGNLDPATSAGIMALLERINASGTTIVMATHAADFVDRMQKRVIELVAGQIVRDEREAGYGHTAALPVVGGLNPVTGQTTLTGPSAATIAAAANAQAAASSGMPDGMAGSGYGATVKPPLQQGPPRVVTAAEQPSIIETTDLVVPQPVFDEVDDITMDAVPELPGVFDADVDDDADVLGSLNELFGINDSKPIQRLPSEPNADVPITERLRIQAQARAKKNPDSDQNVGPVS